MKFTRILLARKKAVSYQGRGEDLKYWKRYLFREKAFIRGPEVKRPLVGYQKTTKHDWYYDENLPMTKVSEVLQPTGKMPLVKPIKDWFIFVGDRVEVLVGRDKGKVGEVVQVVKERNWCFVEGLHLELSDTSYKETGKPFLKQPDFIRLREKPLLVTHEVKLQDPSDQKGTDFDWRYTQDGERVRVSVRSGRIIPIPMRHKETYEDHTYVSQMKPTEKDTTNEHVKKLTFKATMSTFEDDILKNMGIKTWPRKKKSYWY